MSRLDLLTLDSLFMTPRSPQFVWWKGNPNPVAKAAHVNHGWPYLATKRGRTRSNSLFESAPREPAPASAIRISESFVWIHELRQQRETKMKWVWMVPLVVGFVHSSASLAQGPPEFTVFTFGDTSCAAWTKSQTDAALRAQFQAWFRGFVSGYNFGNSANQVLSGTMPNPANIALYVDKFCRENPTLDFIGIVTPLIQEIREVRVPAPIP